MSAVVDTRLMNAQAVQQLGAFLRTQPEARLAAVALVPTADGTVEVRAFGTGDERECIAAATHLLCEARALIEARGAEVDPIRRVVGARIALVLSALSAEVPVLENRA